MSDEDPDVPKRPAVVFEVAQLLVQEHLAALRGYPRNPAGEDSLARTVAECALSVEHAEATLREFDHICPTPREIRDQARNIRDRFVPPAPPAEEQWKAEGYTCDTTFYENLTSPILDRATAVPISESPRDYQHALQLLAKRAPGQLSPGLDELMWRAIKRRLLVKDFSQVPWGKCWHAAHQVGFPLNSEQRQQMNEWLATQRKPATRDGKMLAADPEASTA